MPKVIAAASDRFDTEAKLRWIDPGPWTVDETNMPGMLVKSRPMTALNLLQIQI